MLRAVIFDADGVVINGEGFYVRLEKEFGITNKQMSIFFKGEFEDCLIGKKNIRQVLPKYLELWNWPGSIDDFLNYWFEVEHHVDHALISYIQDLRKNGISCYIATNQEACRTEYILNNMGFNMIFDKVFSSSEIGHKKPQLEFYKSILKAINENVSHVVFWDDNLENVEKAKLVGLNSEQYFSIDDFKNKMEKYLN